MTLPEPLSEPIVGLRKERDIAEVEDAGSADGKERPGGGARRWHSLRRWTELECEVFRRNRRR